MAHPDLDHEHQRAITSIYSTAIVLYQTWPNVQEDPRVRNLVLLLEKLCETLVNGDPPAATKWYGMLTKQCRDYAAGAS